MEEIKFTTKSGRDKFISVFKLIDSFNNEDNFILYYDDTLKLFKFYNKWACITLNNISSFDGLGINGYLELNKDDYDYIKDVCNNFDDIKDYLSNKLVNTNIDQKRLEDSKNICKELNDILTIRFNQNYLNNLRKFIKEKDNAYVDIFHFHFESIEDITIKFISEKLDINQFKDDEDSLIINYNNDIIRTDLFIPLELHKQLNKINDLSINVKKTDKENYLAYHITSKFSLCDVGVSCFINPLNKIV